MVQNEIFALGRVDSILNKTLLLLIAFGVAPPFPLALAYVPTVTSRGTPIRWRSPGKLNLFGNPLNQVGLSPSDFFNAVLLGLQRWKGASAGGIDFDYWQGTDSQTFPPNSNYNGVSSIYFSSQVTGQASRQTTGQFANPGLSSNVLGMTQVWYHTDSGEIFETDIELNDIHFRFTNNPKDTSGFGNEIFSTTGASAEKSPLSLSQVYVQNVITHELGHAFGLSHSGGLQSTMLFMESPEQAHLGCDELIGIHALYPVSDQNQRGTIVGKVLTPSGAPILGAHVVAISQKRGTVLATGLTNPKGEYSLEALEAGIYSILVEPFYAGPQALPSFYSHSSSAVCPKHQSFSRTFATQSDLLHLTPIRVAASQSTRAPLLTLRCDESLPTLDTLDDPVLTPPSGPTENSSSFGIVDQIKDSSPNHYRLLGLSGHLELHALSYTLYSPIKVSMTLEGESEILLESKTFDPVYQGDSGYTNHDSVIESDHLPFGDYTLKVTSEPLQISDYPAGPISIDPLPFYVLTGTINASPPALTSMIPLNTRCRANEDFPNYSSPHHIPSTPSASSYSGGGGCGTLRSKDEDRTRDITPDLRQKEGFFWTGILLIFVCRLAIHLHRITGKANLKE